MDFERESTQGPSSRGSLGGITSGGILGGEPIGWTTQRGIAVNG